MSTEPVPATLDIDRALRLAELPRGEQLALARMLATNFGYIVVPEPTPDAGVWPPVNAEKLIAELALEPTREKALARAITALLQLGRQRDSLAWRLLDTEKERDELKASIEGKP